MLSFLTVPHPPPGDEVGAYEADPSLSFILGHAHQYGLQFGTQHVYTYGPLGFLVFFLYSPQAAAVRLVVDVVFSFTVALGLCLVAWRLRPLWRCLLLGLIAWVAANTEPNLDLIINAGLFCWGLLCFIESGRRLTVASLTFTLLAVFCALAKVSFLFVASLSLVLLAGDLWGRGKRRLAVGIAIGFGAAFLAGWILLGQDLRHLKACLLNALVMVRGYNAALGWETTVVVGYVGFALALLLAGLVLLRTLTAFDGAHRGTKWRRALLLAWVSCFTFTAWKHGFVRGYPCNVAMCFGFAGVVALALESLPCDGAVLRLWTRGMGLLCCCVLALTLQCFFFPAWTKSILLPFQLLPEHLRCMLNPAEHQRRMEDVLAFNRRQAQLPGCREIIGRASADVFGRRQAYAFYNDLAYRPRPVPQSYAVCNAELMRLNEQFYLSKDAPAFVLFELDSLDRKFAPLEDAWVLRDLLINYRLVTTEGRFLLLQSKSANAPKLTLLRDSAAQPGQPIDLREFGDANLWLEVDLRPTWFGRLRQCFIRPPVVRLAAWREPAGKLLYRNRAPDSMLAAGFLASPLLVRNSDVLNLYATNSATRPGAYSIELLPGEAHYWQNPIRIRVYRIENPLAQCAAGRPAQPIADSQGHTVSTNSTAPHPFCSFEPSSAGASSNYANWEGVEGVGAEGTFGNSPMLQHWVGRPNVTPVPKERLNRSDSPTVVVGLGPVTRSFGTGLDLQTAGPKVGNLGLFSVSNKVPSQPFTLFRSTRWRPTQAPPGNFAETLAFGLFLLLPCASIGGLLLFAVRVKQGRAPAGWAGLLLGNSLVLLCLLSAALLAGETYFRFCYDTTDSLAYTRVCERWVQRHWQVNAAGCRDDVEYAPGIAPGQRRISFVGDSFTAGHGIKDVADRFPNRLRQAHLEWEIHVLANVGLDTGAETILLNKAFTKGYQVDQVVLVYCLNDIGDLLPPDTLGAGQLVANSENAPWLVRNSYLINLLYYRYQAARNPAVKNYFPFVRSAYRGPVWEQQKQRLKAFRDLVQSHGGHLSVVTFPFLHALGPNYEYQFVHAELDQFWRELQVPHLDLLPVYQGLSPGQLTVNPYDAHPNEYACHLAARALDQFLASSLGHDRTGAETSRNGRKGR